MNFTITTLLVKQWEILTKELLQTLILAKKMHFTFKMTCCTFVFLQILLAGRLIRFYLNVDLIALKLLNYDQQFCYATTQISCNLLLMKSSSPWVENFELWWKSKVQMDKTDSFISIICYRLTRWFQMTWSFDLLAKLLKKESTLWVTS